MHQPSPKNVAVIGGGITGLCAAFRLHLQGHKVRLFEAGFRLGGSVGSVSVGGWLKEAGPNALMEGEPALDEIIRDLGLQDQLVVANSASKKRFIVRGGRMQALPMSPSSLFSTRLFSAGMKFRLFAEMLKGPKLRDGDISLEQLIREHFGQEAVDYGLNPFVSGVYAGDPALLSGRYAFPKLWEAEQKHGSIIRGMMAGAKLRKAAGRPKPRLISFRQGLQTLIDGFEGKLPEGCVSQGALVKRLQRGSCWSVEFETDGGMQREDFDCVLLALPPRALAAIEIGDAGQRPLSGLSSLAHPAVSSLFLGFRRDQVAHPLDGFGALVPAMEKRKILGILFSSSLFEGRAPDGHVGLTIMAGGMRQPEIAALPEDDLLKVVLPELRDLLGVSGEPVFQLLHSWSAAIPQYNLGHEKFLALMDSCEKANPGLYIGGNSRDGISVPSCMASGLRLAACVA
jgi:oxygen-dependent protoporphyrinogen oxidase